MLKKQNKQKLVFRYKYFFLFVFSVLIFIIHSLIVGHAIYGDGNAYYSYSQALYFEKKLDFNPIYNFLSHFPGKKSLFSRVFWDTEIGPLGIRKNPFMIGTGLVWVPSLAIIDFFDNLLHLNLGRFSLYYELGPGITGIICGLLGLFFLEKYLNKYFSNRTVLLTILGLFFASNLLYYLSFEPALAPQPVFLIISFLIWFTDKKITARQYFIIGILSGFVYSLRHIDVLLTIPFLIIPFIQQKTLKNIWFISVGFLFGLSPQLINQYFVYGNVFFNTYLMGGGANFSFKLANFWLSLFGVKRGLFIWHPIYLLGLIGFWMVRNKKLNLKLFFLTIVLYWLVTSNFPENLLSDAFGVKGFLSTIPFWSYGLAYLIEKYQKKICLTLGVLILWNFLLLFQFYADPNRVLRGIGLTYGNLISGQITTPINFVRSIFADGFSKTVNRQILD